MEVAYLIDPDRAVLDLGLKNFEKRTQGKFTCKGVKDVRQALEDKTLDALGTETDDANLCV